MKRVIFILVAAICSLLTVRATDNLVVPDITISQGGEGLIDIQLNNELPYVTFAFWLNLPEGINYVDMEVNEERFSPQAGKYTPIKEPSDDGRTIALGSLGITETPYAGNSGTLVTVKFTADESLEIGTVLNATITGIKFSTNDGEKTLEDVSFTITIGEPADTHTILDETSTTAPEASDGPVDVRVKRTIKANQWSTICLPFAMTAAQMEVAFGADVELADFAGCDIEMDEYENTVGITIKFETTTSIEANHPYIIKVGEPITEFTVDGVEITPENEPSVQSLALRIGKGTKLDPYVYFYDYFIGTYVANTTLPAVSMFLNNNQFWYSTGATKMKGYRAYFALYFNLTDVENTYAAVKMAFNVDGIPTDIQDIVPNHNNGNTYDLNGRRIVKPQQKGVYIKDGKKAFIK